MFAYALNFPAFLESLKYMGYGMAGIFVVMLIIYGLVKLLSIVFKPEVSEDDLD